ncbi:hypothetical protein [uncultured Enterovirga sp.]|uniref:hypothetical protein n=1 Tax=uncultured Enterovirga sp. TaxID=2026352 RepID=UPI0035CC3871
MTTPEAEAAILTDLVRSGERLRRNLLASLDKLRPRLPMTSAVLAAQSPAEAEMVDAFILRFANLTVLVNDHLLRAILIAEKEDLSRRSRRDALDLAEKLGALDPSLDVNAVVKARNRIAHVYPDNSAKQASAINEIVDAVPTLVAIFDGLARFATDRGLVPPAS